MKKTVILIHGLRGTHHGLKYVAEQLSSEYRVLTPDLPGSGARMELKNKTINGYIDWLHQYICDLKLKQKPYLAAHSMGSIVVSHYLEKYSDDVQKKVVLISPIFRTKSSQAINNIYYDAFSVAAHVMPKKIRTRFLRGKFLSYCVSHILTYDKTKQKQIDQLHYRYSGRFSSADSLLADAKIASKQQTVIPRQNEVLLIMGAKDHLTSLKLARKKIEQYDISISVIPNAGHLINYEKPKLIAEDIAHFIK